MLRHGAEGVGLFRSEFIYLLSRGAPSEDAQYRSYREVLEKVAPRPVTIRTFDLGGDKSVGGLTVDREDNPILGWRAIRFCLANPTLFKTQLRAILRASVHGHLKIMFPMISGLEELEQSIAML